LNLRWKYNQQHSDVWFGGRDAKFSRKLVSEKNSNILFQAARWSQAISHWSRELNSRCSNPVYWVRGIHEQNQIKSMARCN